MCYLLCSHPNECLFRPTELSVKLLAFFMTNDVSQISITTRPSSRVFEQRCLFKECLIIYKSGCYNYLCLSNDYHIIVIIFGEI